jgi:hypothetical protein
LVGACTEGPKGLASRQGKIPNPIESPLVRKGCATAAATRFFSMPGFLPEAGSTGIPSGQWCVCVVLALLHEREISASFEPGEAPAAVRGRPMTSEEVVLPENKLSPILLCCSPSLLGCWPSLCSLFRFRLTVFIPFWPHLSLAGDLRLLVRTRHTCYDSDRNRHSGEAQAKPSHISQSDGMADDNYQRARKFVCFTRYDGMNGCNRSVTLKIPSVGTGAAPLPAGKILDKLCAFRYWETADFDCC